MTTSPKKNSLYWRVIKHPLPQTSYPPENISRETLAELRAKLPKGSAIKIQARLEKKRISFTKQYIYRCLDPNHKDYNQDIIDEAILFGEENAIQMKELRQRIEQLNSAIL